MNVGGDYEFIIKEASAEKIVMQGKKYGNTIVMYALPDDLNWEAYINSVNDVERMLSLYNISCWLMEI